MQQYYDTGGLTLSVFHRPDQVSFDVEHVGGGSLDDIQKLKDLYEGKLNSIKLKDRGTVELTKTDDGGLHLYIDGRRENEYTLTPEQFDTLVACLGSGDNSVGYDVESVDRDGNRN